MIIDKQIAEAKILDPNGTYLIEGSILPVFMDEEGNVYICENYEKGEEVHHMIDDLRHDGVMFNINPMGFENIGGSDD